MNNLVVIHIGKCGGSTVCKELKNNNIKYSEIHVANAKYQPDKTYVIVIRNPRDRFISAFNWRYHLVCHTKLQENRFINEKNILRKYRNIDYLCSDLKKNPNIFNGTKTSGHYVHHLKEDIHFYLKNFIDKCPKKQILGVICTETLDNDMQRIFNINVKIHAKKNKKYSNTISQASNEILMKYLKKDYFIIEKMYKYNWITEGQYKFLKL